MRIMSLVWALVVGFSGGYLAGHYTGEALRVELCDATRATVIERMENPPEIFDTACPDNAWPFDTDRAPDHPEPAR